MATIKRLLLTIAGICCAAWFSYQAGYSRGYETSYLNTLKVGDKVYVKSSHHGEGINTIQSIEVKDDGTKVYWFSLGLDEGYAVTADRLSYATKE